MRRNTKSFVGLTVLGIIVLVTVVYAEVFTVQGGARSVSTLNNGRYRWQDAYKTTMLVNGRKSSVELYSVQHSEPVLSQLESRFTEMGATVKLLPGQDGATGTARWPDHEARFLVLSPASLSHHLVFVTYPEAGAVPKPVRFPVPEYEDSEVQQTVVDDGTGVFLATLSTGDDSTLIHDYYARRMADEGWTLLAVPPVMNGAISGMAVYVKNERVCYVQAVNRPGQENMITLLVKGGKL